MFVAFWAHNPRPTISIVKENMVSILLLPDRLVLGISARFSQVVSKPCPMKITGFLVIALDCDDLRVGIT